MKIKLIPHDRSHYPSSGGHAACGKQSCLDSENLVKAHALKYNRVRDPNKPYFYNGSSENNLISEKKLYLCRIEGGWIVDDGWYLGHFSKEHYGWCFDGWYAPMQMSSIWLVIRSERHAYR